MGSLKRLWEVQKNEKLLNDLGIENLTGKKYGYDQVSIPKNPSLFREGKFLITIRVDKKNIRGQASH